MGGVLWSQHQQASKHQCNKRLGKRNTGATSPFPIMHLIYPQKNLHEHCFQFLLGRL